MRPRSDAGSSLDAWPSALTSSTTPTGGGTGSLPARRNRAPATEMRSCAVCATSLEGRRRDAIYCSTKCRDDGRTKVRERRGNCLACDAPIFSKRKDALYCSSACQQGAWAREQGHPWYLAQYGLTLEDYERMLDQQGGVCAICGTSDPRHGRSRRFCVDHDHSTGRVRALLCANCNKALGLLADDPDRVRSAERYLRLHATG